MGYKPEDFTRATEYANTKASKFTLSWHNARNGYLMGLLDERRAKHV